MKFWIKTSFWNYLRNILALFGPTGGVVTGKYLEDPFWTGVGLVCLAVSGAIAILMADKNNNNIVDIFEKDK